MVEQESTTNPIVAKAGAGSLADLSGRIELIDDNIILNEEFKKNVAIPYFKDIYKDLAAQSDAKSKGINKVSILNVSPLTSKISRVRSEEIISALSCRQIVYQPCRSGCSREYLSSTLKLILEASEIVRFILVRLRPVLIACLFSARLSTVSSPVLSESASSQCST